ncbi:class I SAM-dependent methyltransferase, partial [candidate division KSB1 bacterium]
MKILETQPSRYDLGLSLLSLGGINRVRRRIVRQYLSPGAAVLDIGTGTGALAGLMARQEMEVVALDPSPAMLAVARERWETEQGLGKLKFLEAGVAQMDSLFEEGCFDAVTACLVFSELSPDEVRYTLEQT